MNLVHVRQSVTMSLEEAAFCAGFVHGAFFKNDSSEDTPSMKLTMTKNPDSTVTVDTETTYDSDTKTGKELFDRFLETAQNRADKGYKVSFEEKGQETVFYPAGTN